MSSSAAWRGCGGGKGGSISSGWLAGRAGGAGTARGTGGMQTKLHAASICMENGVDMIIADGSRPTLLYDIADSKPVGTKFYGKKDGAK